MYCRYLNLYYIFNMSAKKSRQVVFGDRFNCIENIGPSAKKKLVFKDRWSLMAVVSRKVPLYGICVRHV